MIKLKLVIVGEDELLACLIIIKNHPLNLLYKNKSNDW